MRKRVCVQLQRSSRCMLMDFKMPYRPESSDGTMVFLCFMVLHIFAIWDCNVHIASLVFLLGAAAIVLILYTYIENHELLTANVSALAPLPQWCFSK
ncbi:hypothetical protein BXZ70DRAFT_120829 [Cristinia sonorae]|uniref:Uncharacterized protein n=1 Tax=Cristinia sonorae TaxID=1940300 RepID=A0A8K0UPL1_9AGAR|nr:hypothetical protein BXZ70DRAFT_120829 [Cristinia sonorae]